MKTDNQLQTDVIAELHWDPSINPADIGVEVKDGVVTLSGHVSSFAEKWSAEHAAQRVSGVMALAVEMDVNLFGLGKRTDADIASSAESVLTWTTFLPKESVKVMVEDGWVTLSGDVDWEYQRVSALNAISSLMGVKGIIDHIKIATKVSKILVKSDIEAALKRRATKDAQNITVEVDGNDVTLRGKVHSWSERELATDSAWCTPGVNKVKDYMTIAY